LTDAGQVRTAAATKIRIALSNSAFVRFVPLKMALEDLRAQGYTVEVIQAARFDLVPEMLVRGDADLGSLSPQGGWAAVAKGAPLISLVANFAPTWTVVGSAKIQGCQDLGRYPVGFSTTTGVQQAMLTSYTQEHCPGTVPEILVVGASPDRMAALLGGHLEVSSLELEEVLKLDEEAPGAFHPIVRASRDFPDVQNALITTTRGWAQANPAAVKAFIRALVLENRRVNDDPALLKAEISKQLGLDDARAQQMATTFLAEKTWDVNGGLTEQNVARTLELLQRIELVPANMKGSDIADLSYLNAVLDEIGRR
jgi:ABC-type nitrate/sulfonate/bicarbonate transport system substrate-binding protein